jgi:DMSO/TMAO reductase YedYZ heme-binding membrane subunit
MTLMALLDAAVGVALWIAGLVALVLYYRFALTSTAGFRVAMTAFWRRLAAFAPPGIVAWLGARLVVESYGVNSVALEALFGAGIALLATRRARRALRKKEAAP